MVANPQSRFSRAKLAAAALLMFAVAACASPFNAKVSRFQSQLPAPSGQTFAVVADDPGMAGGIEFSQYARLVDEWVSTVGLDKREYSTHSLRRTTGNLRAVQILLGHTNIENTVRYLGVDVDDALTLSERTEI